MHVNDITVVKVFQNKTHRQHYSILSWKTTIPPSPKNSVNANKVFIKLITDGKRAKEILIGNNENEVKQKSLTNINCSFV